MRRGRFFTGAVGGLALALLLVGLASLLPQTNSPLSAASTQQPGGAHSVTTTLATSAPVTSKTTNSSAQFIGAPGGARVAGNSTPAASLSNETTTTSTGSSALSSASGVRNLVPAGPAAAGGAQAQKPSSLLAVLPGESVGSLIATVSPLLIGLLVAALFYGAYARRQDSS